jgi:hypothetical protein
MWMLLEPRVSRGASEQPAAESMSARAARSLRAAQGNGASRPVEALLAVIGASSPVEYNEDVGVFLHPGRALLATVSLERFFDQFDCRSRDVFPTLAEAEAAFPDDVGFLLEVRRPFTDNGGRRRDHGVLFARSVRS